MPSVGSFQHPSPQVPPQRINALHVPQMRCDGVAAGALAPLSPQAGPGSNQVRGGSHPAPRIPLRCVPLVCHPALTSGLPEARLESRSWPAPVSRHRNFRRSATGGTGPDPSSGRRHARHRLDEGVRQSRPGHPGVGRFGLWFPRRSPDREVRTSAAAFPRRPDWDTVGGPSAAPHRILRILSGPT